MSAKENGNATRYLAFGVEGEGFVVEISVLLAIKSIRSLCKRCFMETRSEMSFAALFAQAKWLASSCCPGG
jgi:hypothetical protein